MSKDKPENIAGASKTFREIVQEEIKKTDVLLRPIFEAKANEDNDWIGLTIADKELGLLRLDVGHAGMEAISIVLPIEMVTHIIADSFIKYREKAGMTNIDMVETSNWPTRHKMNMRGRLIKYNEKSQVHEDSDEEGEDK